VSLPPGSPSDKIATCLRRSSRNCKATLLDAVYLLGQLVQNRNKRSLSLLCRPVVVDVIVGGELSLTGGAASSTSLLRVAGEEEQFKISTCTAPLKTIALLELE
jgi:hypothetical protein